MEPKFGLGSGSAWHRKASKTPRSSFSRRCDCLTVVSEVQVVHHEVKKRERERERGREGGRGDGDGERREERSEMRGLSQVMWHVFRQEIWWRTGDFMPITKGVKEELPKPRVEHCVHTFLAN